MRFSLIAVACFAFVSSTKAQDAKIVKLIEDLDSASKTKRLEAMRELGIRGAAAGDAIPALAKQLRRKEDDEANQAGRALAQIGPAAVSEVVKALDDDSPAVRNRALLTLGTMGRDAGKACSLVARFLEHKDAKARLLAALVLGAMHEQAAPAGPLLETALRDKDPRVRFVASDSLFQIGLAGIPHLVAGVKADDADVRLKAVTALGRCRDSDEALQALAAALKDKEPRVRAGAADALIRAGVAAKSVGPTLLDLLKEGDPEIQAMALGALFTIRETGDAKFNDALSEANEYVLGPRYVWTKTDPGKIPMMKALLSSPDPTHRLAGAIALAHVGPKAKAFLPLLKSLATDRDRSVRAAAYLATALIEGKDGKAIDKAADLFEDALERQRGSSDLGELVRLHMVISALPALASSGERPSGKVKDRVTECAQEVRKRLDEREIPFEQFPSVVEAMNLTAQWNLGFTEPFNSLSLKVQKTIEAGRDPRVAILYYKSLGSTVAVDSIYWPAIQRQWADGIAKVPLEFLVAERQQILAAKARRQGLVSYLSGFA